MQGNKSYPEKIRMLEAELSRLSRRLADAERRERAQFWAERAARRDDSTTPAKSQYSGFNDLELVAH